MLKRGYHHGNLKEALVDACLRLIAERGPQGFTLSEAAREAGVTPAAVYRHFEGREDLIAEASRQGYAIFADLMEHAYNGGQPSALAAFESVGRASGLRAQVSGALRGHVRKRHLDSAHRRIGCVAGRATGVLEKAARDLSQHIPPEKRPPAAMFSAHIWR